MKRSASSRAGRRSPSRPLFAVLACAWMLLGATDADEALRMSDFARGRTIELRSSTPLHSLWLDREVYRGSVEPRLADLRVFDGQGHVVPHAIRSNPPEPEHAAIVRDVPIFVLRNEPVDPAKLDGPGYQIDAEISEKGAILSVKGGGGGASAGPGATAWLLDVSGLPKRDIDGLTFQLGGGDEDFVARIRIDKSDDLVRFQRHGEIVALARLEQAGHRIERNQIFLPRLRTRYLRVTSIGAPLPVAIERVEARLVSPRPAIRREWTRITGQSVEGERGVTLFDLEGVPPIDRLQVDLGGLGHVLDATIEAGPAVEGPWRQRESGLVYQLDREGPLRNPPFSFVPGDRRYLKLTLSNRGGGVIPENPVLEVGWQPERLLFVAQGDGPYTLAYGRIGLPDGAYHAKELLQIAHIPSSRIREASAELGPVQELAGDAALTPPPEPVPWQTIALWTVLVVCVVFVVGLSLRLLRQTEA